jgi:hypothetical protein
MRKLGLGVEKERSGTPSTTRKVWSRRYAMRHGRRRLRKRWMRNLPSNDSKLELSSRSKEQGKAGYWPFALFACAVVTTAALRSVFNADRPPPPSPAGWDDLIACSYLVSFDGSKQLELFKHRRAILWAVGSNKLEKIAEGQWSFDENSKQYMITINGLTDSYSIVSLPLAPDFSCALIVGTINSAELQSSWFSIPAE